MLSWLKQPYPFVLGNKRVVWVSILIGLLVFFVTYVFKPLGIADCATTVSYLEACLVNGLIALLVVFAALDSLPRAFPKMYDPDNWKVYKEVLNICFVLFVVSILNVLYEWSIFAEVYQQFHLFAFEVIWKTFLIGLFPAALYVVYKYFFYLKINQNQAVRFNQLEAEGNQATCVRLLEAKSFKDSIEIDVSKILYIESSGNYVEFHLENDLTSFDEQISKRIIVRNSLQSVEAQLSDLSFIFRTHRTFIVNLNKIESYSGNAQGYLLKFSGKERQVPVARGRLKEFNAVMDNKVKTTGNNTLHLVTKS